MPGDVADKAAPAITGKRSRRLASIISTASSTVVSVLITGGGGADLLTLICFKFLPALRPKQIHFVTLPTTLPEQSKPEGPETD
jgi:hypothetical protein